MFLDASAVIAIIAGEPDADSLQARLDKAEAVQVSAIVIYESVLGLARVGAVPIDDARSLVDRFLDEVDAEILSIDATIGRRAIDAFARFGKGQHPAALNLGDCFAYACAEASQMPLLCKGDDFRRTDIVLA